MGMGVVVWLKNTTISRRVSSIVDRERFQLPGHKGWRSRGEGAEHVQRSRGSDALKSALGEGSWASRRSSEEGVEKRQPVMTLHAALCRTSR